jgi:hypothetical protein
MWQGKERQNNFVFFQNEVQGSRASCDAFGGKAVGELLFLFELMLNK